MEISQEILAFILGLVPTIATGIALFYWQRAQKKRDSDNEIHAEARKTEALLSLELQMATAKLSYAVAMAIKRGTPNGEVEEGVEAYTKAKDKYTNFLNGQAKEHLSEN